MDSPGNPFACSSLDVSVANPTRLPFNPPAHLSPSPSPSLAPAAEANIVSAAEDVVEEQCVVAQPSDAPRLPALASSFTTPNNSVGDIYERLPAAWAAMSLAEQAKIVGWVEVSDENDTEHLLMRGEEYTFGQGSESASEGEEEEEEKEQDDYFSIFMENEIMMCKNLMSSSILVDGVSIRSDATCVIKNNSSIQPSGCNFFYAIYLIKKLTLRIEDPSPDFGTTINSKYAVTTQRLGSGAFGSVFYGEIRNNKTPVAIKISDKKYIKGAAKEVCINSFADENTILVMAQGHQAIIQVVDVHETAMYSYLVLEYVAGGDLHSYCAQHGPLLKDEARHIFKQLLEAVKFLHSKHIVHCDIKPANILLRKCINNPAIVLTDFGAAWKIVPDSPPPRKKRGTLGYMAPEMVLKSAFKDQAIAKAKEIDINLQAASNTMELTASNYHQVDVWSLGATLHYMLSNTLPYVKNSNEDVIVEDYALDLLNNPLEFDDTWEAVSEEGRELVRNLLALNSDSRITIEQALASSWFNKPQDTVAEADVAQEEQEEPALKSPEKEAEIEPSQQRESNQTEDDKEAEETTACQEASTPQRGIKRSHSMTADTQEKRVKISNGCTIL
ncbi:kinase-like domain-containing protein [Syncephalis fuscata]|nr:kinase-like domain-containing protein [Syncephalis fuscata]